MSAVSVLIPVFNEEQNIAKLLDRVGRSDGRHERDIVVIASGCTDRTAQLAHLFAAEEPRVRVLEQPLREGKASAISLGLGLAYHDAIVLISGDVLPEPDALDLLVARLAEPGVGAVGARPVPLNARRGLTGFAVFAMWRLHHLISLTAAEPKCGEMMAFRRRDEDGRGLIVELPDTAVDEASIQAMVSRAGLRSVYEPRAVVNMWGPKTLRDWMIQRRRINAGHIQLSRTGYQPSTMSVGRTLAAILRDRELRWHPFRMTALACMEGVARLAGWLDVVHGRSHTVWTAVESTKQPIEVSRT
jgi:cellulose synthase/poly-beta-1,6-N-acetylglucosamine synthase-like glycosyltransferase